MCSALFANIVIGFVVPWLLAIYLMRKSSIIILITLPITSLVAILSNTFGFQLKFWTFTPLIQGEESISALPLDLGLYPVIACYMVYWIRNSQTNHLVILFVTILFTTLLEYIALLIGKTSYSNGWNIYWTFVSYLVAYVIVYVYYRILAIKHRFIDTP